MVWSWFGPRRHLGKGKETRCSGFGLLLFFTYHCLYEYWRTLRGVAHQGGSKSLTMTIHSIACCHINGFIQILTYGSENQPVDTVTVTSQISLYTWKKWMLPVDTVTVLSKTYGLENQPVAC
jgi:hypothetical protein